jgi:O-antigen/teichoic acid export membrane protein
VLKGPVAKATIGTSAVLALRLFLQAGTLLLIARALGPQLFGAFAGIAALAILLGTLSTLGTHLVLLGEASRAYRRRLRVLPYTVSTTLLCGTLLLAIYMLLVRSIFVSSPIPLDLVILIGITELFLQPLISIPSAQLQARRKIVTSQLVFLAPLTIRFLVILTIFVAPVQDVLRVFVTGSLIAGVVGIVIASMASPMSWPAFRHWRLATAPELRHSVGFAALNITGAAPAEIDKSLAARLLPLAAAGLYSGAARIVSAVSLPVVAMLQAALPRLFHESSQTRGITPLLLTSLYGSALLYGVGAAIVMWLLVPLLGWLFGDDYVGIGEIASLLCAAIPGTTLRLTNGVILMARGRPWQRIVSELAGIAAIVIAALLLVPKYGISGMIAAYIAAEWLTAVVGVSFVLAYRNPVTREKLNESGNGANAS